MLRRALVLTVLLALTAAADAGAVARSETPVTETAASGTVQAQLSYVRVVDNGFTSYKNLRLTISRDGRAVPSSPPHPGGIDLLWPGYAWKKGAKSVHVADLDGDGEPEVSLDLNTGGAHCCWMFWAYRWDGASYTSLEIQAGSFGYTQRDLNSDGRPEWVATDPRFEYLFTSFAGSGVPLRIYAYQAAKFVVVTKRYPALIRKDAARYWRFVQQGLKAHPRDVRGLFAAWAADEYLLGKGTGVWPVLNAAARRGELGGDRGLGPTGAAYIAKLRLKLRQFGYA
jgi:hypothetical protein